MVEMLQVYVQKISMKYMTILHVVKVNFYKKSLLQNNTEHVVI